MLSIVLNINGEYHDIDVEEDEKLLFTLRERLDFTGAKEGCNSATCGACTVLIDNEARKSCIIYTKSLENTKITTIEGLALNEKLHPIQDAFIEAGAVQCGYCTPGMIMLTLSLINKKNKLTEKEVRKYYDKNLCRCTGYENIVKAYFLSLEKCSK